MSTRSPFRIRIMVVEDHPIVRHGYALLINSQHDMEICSYSATESEALQQTADTMPNMAIVDISLRDGDGIDLVRKLKSRYDGLNILVISAQSEELYAERALEAGALGYINKQQAMDQLINGIRTVAAGEMFLSEQMTRRLLRHSVTRATGRCDSSAVRSLTNRELCVYELIGNGRTTKQIAAQLHLSPKTIERYRENIKQKLQITSATELVQRATRWMMEKS